MTLDQIVEIARYPIADATFWGEAKRQLDTQGCVELPGFLSPQALSALQQEAREKQSQAYFCAQQHNVYLLPPDPNFAALHPRNRTLASTKGCITDDQVSPDSVLRTLYREAEFHRFLCRVLDQQQLFPYADPLSSINIHYARPGQELGWHFDNSSFAITLMIDPAESGGQFEYVRNVRDSHRQEMNYETVEQILEGRLQVERLDLNAGTLLLFRGRDSLHRVTPVEGGKTRMLAVLAYNDQPDVCLSESARMTFYGRLE